MGKIASSRLSGLPKKIKPKRKYLNEAPLQQWGQLETTPKKTIHIDHKGQLRPISNGKTIV